ncbi:Cof-type HAD-IIB family hydrolase [Pasteurella sp. PK-2025]|uniref:Cof-type HAD-IIB family hydrolase n=1 Tax=unclassified Pasteurella TaxID=2621516 RepID=UPI003C77F204
MNIPNYRNQIKIVFFDIDETLLIKDEDRIPDSVIPALNKLHENGIITAIATGRTQANFSSTIKEFIAQVNIDLFVTINGQYIDYKNAPLEKNTLPTAKIQELVDFFDQHQIEYAQVSPTHMAISAATEEVCSALDTLKGRYHVEKDYFKRNEVFQILAFYNDTKDELVKNSGVLTGLQTVRWHKNSIDLFDANISKASGIAAAIRHLGFDMENVMAFGDGLNDIEMLRTVGVGVAMGNAQEVVKNAARHVTRPIDQDGIHYFLTQAGLLD